MKTVKLPKGKFIAYKKVVIDDDTFYRFNYGLVTLEVDEDAKRIMGVDYCWGQNWEQKIRVSKAKVLKIESLDGKKIFNKGSSHYQRNFRYEVGAVVEPRKKFSSDKKRVCASGIHCFLTKRRAIRYTF